MACRGKQLWWFRFTCFFFFGGLACFVPQLTPHLRWLGLNLREISLIHLISGILSMTGLVLAAASSTHRGHRTCLAIALLLAAFSGAALIFMPRLQGRDLDREGPAPVAELLCSQDGSVLFFRKCGDSCDLDRAKNIEIQVSECRFEPKTRIPTSVKGLIEEFNFFTSDNEGNTDFSEPERGDLPEKIVVDEPVQEETKTQQHSTEESEKKTTQEEAAKGHFSDDYDYYEQHKQVKNTKSASEPDTADYDYDTEVNSDVERRKRQVTDQEDFPEFETDEVEIPSHAQPHLCYETSPQSKLCHVFTSDEHSFRLESSFPKAITRDSRCFYPLYHTDNQNQLLSEVHCRLHRDDLQVRCKAEGMDLRARVAKNGSDICSEDPGNFHLTFWLYLIFRTLAEIGVIAAAILLLMVALDCEQRELMDLAAQQQPRPRFLGCWWFWALLGVVVSSVGNSFLGSVFGYVGGFLLGAVLLGLAAFTIALAPHQKEQQEPEKQDQFQEEGFVSLQNFWICRRLLGRISTHRKAFWILALMILYGAAYGHVHTTFYWHLAELRLSYFFLELSMIIAVFLVWTILPIHEWLFIRCGHNYIFMIGTLLYSVRFFGYALVADPHIAICLEVLEVPCGCWMLVTATSAIGLMESPQKGSHRWKVNAWALVIVFYYSIGRGLGSLYAGLFAHYFSPIHVFMGSGIMFVLGAALWLLLYLTVAKSQKKYQVHNEQDKRSRGVTASKPDKQQSDPAYTQLEIQKAKH